MGYFSYFLSTRWNNSPTSNQQQSHPIQGDKALKFLRNAENSFTFLSKVAFSSVHFWNYFMQSIHIASKWPFKYHKMVIFRWWVRGCKKWMYPQIQCGFLWYVLCHPNLVKFSLRFEDVGKVWGKSPCVHSLLLQLSSVLFVDNSSILLSKYNFLSFLALWMEFSYFVPILLFLFFI